VPGYELDDGEPVGRGERGGKDGAGGGVGEVVEGEAVEAEEVVVVVNSSGGLLASTLLSTYPIFLLRAAISFHASTLGAMSVSTNLMGFRPSALREALTVSSM
jgi:hypothetical protein